MHYILIDYENVQPADLAGLGAEQAYVFVFTGSDQKVGIALIEAVQALGEHGRFIRIAGNGRNALDFHIACYLGQWMVRDPQATFLIVSKDTGFDPLIAHLNATGTLIKRIEPPAKKATAKVSKKAVTVIVEKAATPQPAKKKAVAKKAEKKVAVVATVSPQSDAEKIIKGLKGMAKNLPGSEASLRRMASTWLASQDGARMDSAISELGRRKVIDLTEPKVRYALPK
ncbi:PIN domain-containing protein [Pseudoxanthomonas koreensis]|uniref:PIN domain-containing protein n=1 Tax=Pseudoxanthomonas koreensis TaxID=266061 RepID=UPI001390711A|nr:PIN domain-containing protein [Pseudoxanthomonas koreensis]KAF1690639.1 hypothetical protein CSC64_11125 [Pseudoxanthomonas koreensis]